MDLLDRKTIGSNVPNNDVTCYSNQSLHLPIYPSTQVHAAPIESGVTYEDDKDRTYPETLSGIIIVGSTCILFHLWHCDSGVRHLLIFGIG